jgi:2-iminobutanoate/2-iminopropanoate deaminase
MKQTAFVSIALAAIAFLLYLNFFSHKKAGFTHTCIFTDKAPAPIGPYSQAVLTGNTLFVAGQIALDPASGKLDTLDIGAETRRVLENVRAILQAAKMDLGNVVKTTIYLSDLGNFKPVNAIYEELLTPFCSGADGTKTFPARETVQVAALPKGAHLEISVVAVK